MSAEEHRDVDESIARRPLPQLADLSFKNIASWLFGFIENYLFSRNLRGGLLAVPFCIFGIAGSGFIWWLNVSPKNAIVTVYEQASEESHDKGNIEATSTYLKALVKLRPANRPYRFRLALQLLKTDKKAEGVNYLRELIDPGPNGYNPARLWLVSQADRDEPLIPISEEAVEGQLRLILETDRMNLEANRRLAKLHLSSGRLKEVESRLLRIVERAPELGLPLVEVQMRLNRSPEGIAIHLSNAIHYFEGLLLKSPNNTNARVCYSKALMLADRQGDAIQSLTEGMKVDDSMGLKTARSEVYLSIVQKRLSDSQLNRDPCARLLADASKFDPGNRKITRKILGLSRLGATFSKEDLAPAVDSLARSGDRTQEDDLILAQMLALVERFDEAISILDKHAASDMRVSAVQTAILMTAQKTEDANKIAQKLLEEVEEKLVNGTYETLNTEERLAYVNVLVLTSRFAKARTVIKSILTTPELESTPQYRDEKKALSVSLARACLGLFEQQFAAAKPSEGATAIKLLDEALSTNSATTEVLDRLGELTSLPGEFSKPAEQALTRLLASGFANSEIYNRLGTAALKLDDVPRALTYLERGFSLDGRNPMILNNLALALVRSAQTEVNVERAMGFIQEVLVQLPDHPDALSTRAEILVAMQRWEDARRDLEIVIPQRKTSRNSRQLIATVYDALGESALAEEHRRILSELDESNSNQSLQN